MLSKTTWTVIVVVIIIILGSILHFTYEWTDDNQFVGYFSSVNESVWEHLKLIFFPVIIAALVFYYIGLKKNDRNKNLWSSIFLAAIVGMIFIVISFYTYTGAITEESVIGIDLLIFVIAAILSAVIIIAVMTNLKCSSEFEKLSFLLVLIIMKNLQKD